MTTWLGVDVGGPVKRFDIALVDERRLLRLEGGLGVDAVVNLVRAERPAVVAIDSPRRCAPDGHTSRDDERLLARTVCGIRWTPDAAAVHANPYYAWIVEGLRLYAALDGAAIEVFPTASWTRWLGPRGTNTRAAWTRDGLRRLGLDGIADRTNQDQRDAIAAAVTARLHSQGRTEMIGDIVIPRGAPR